MGGGGSWIVMTMRDRWMSSRSGMPNACNNTGWSRAATSRLASSRFPLRFVTGVRSKFSISPKRLSTDPGKAPFVECSFSFRFNRLRKSCAALFAYNSLQVEESTMIPELTCPFATNSTGDAESPSSCGMVKPLSCIVRGGQGLARDDRSYGHPTLSRTDAPGRLRLVRNAIARGSHCKQSRQQV